MNTKIFAYCTNCGRQGAHWTRQLSGCECAVEEIIEQEIRRPCECGGEFLFLVPTIETKQPNLS